MKLGDDVVVKTLEQFHRGYASGAPTAHILELRNGHSSSSGGL